MRTRRILPPPADLLVVDECHHAPARTWQKIIGLYPGASVIGLTATPCRSDGRGLGGIFDAIVECPQLAERMDRTDLIGDIVSHWHRYGEGRRTVVFAVNVPHSVHICEEFIKSGVR